ncbi:MAG: hypothetical protein QOG62_579 [Thermoleophilaceae bacterium]|jgi:hypothetical protein|nr:hypothetical protein [Thermoleophilaceae bacterium]
MGIIFAQLGDELPARHLVEIEPGSTVGDAQAAVRAAFNLPEDAGLELAFDGQALPDQAATLEAGTVPADAVLTAART